MSGPGAPKGAGWRYASIAPRLAAGAVDVALFCAAFFPITRLVKGVWLMAPSDHRWVRGLFISDPLCLAFLVAMAAYYVLGEGLTGATVGKWALRLRVVGPDGRAPGLWRAALRNLLRLVDGLPALSLLGIVLVLRSPERARLGDRLAGTRVIHIHRPG